MNKQTETLSKAMAKLPLTIDKPEASNGYAYVRDADGIEICICYGRGEEHAALIVQAVNQYEALCAVVEAAQALHDIEYKPVSTKAELTDCWMRFNEALAALEAVRKGAQ